MGEGFLHQRMRRGISEGYGVNVVLIIACRSAPLRYHIGHLQLVAGLVPSGTLDGERGVGARGHGGADPAVPRVASRALPLSGSGFLAGRCGLPLAPGVRAACCGRALAALRLRGRRSRLERRLGRSIVAGVTRPRHQATKAEPAEHVADAPLGQHDANSASIARARSARRQRATPCSARRPAQAGRVRLVPGDLDRCRQADLREPAGATANHSSANQGLQQASADTTGRISPGSRRLFVNFTAARTHGPKAG